MRLRALVPAALALALAPAAASAAPSARIVGVDSGGYPELRVTVVAPPGARSPVLRENGAAVTGLEALNLGRAKSVVLAVDRSQSMKGRSLLDAVAAARAFVAAKTPADRVEVVAFGRQAYALTGFSSSTADADAALRQLEPDARSGTALWDAVALASRRLAKEAQPGHVIIVLTDGADVSSSASFRSAVAAAQRAHASVYAVGIAGPDFTPAPLRELAEDTGGTYHQASSSAALARVYAQISRTLSHTWELRYPTVARPGDTLTLTASFAGAGRDSTSVRLAARGASGTTVAPSLLPGRVWASPVMPLAVALLVGLLVLLAVAFAFASQQGRWVRARLAPHLSQTRRAAASHRKRERRSLLRGLFTATDGALANVRQFRSLQRLLERADLPLRASELLYICLGSAFTLGLLIAVTVSSPLAILIAMAVGAALPVAFVKVKAAQRIKAFDNQLPDLLITISASLKAGHSFRHAIQAVVDEGAEPGAKEFTRVLSEAKLGRQIDEALVDMAERVGSKNLSFVMTSVTIQRQVGGSLAGLFDMVADTVRQRQQFTRKIKGLTAMGRMSAYVLVGLPFFIALAVSVLNPRYMAPLYHTSSGHMLVVAGLVMMGVGSLILKKMVAFRG
ncbi:MAG TPA: VWA domain-containing protein [Gaiellaceae bacterium]|nr:VWA domain-containing protein [Gaiellaceae bacterium]